MEVNIRISDKDKLQHYLEQLYDDYKDSKEADMGYNNPRVCFEGVVERMNQFIENNTSTMKASGFESAANVEERRQVDMIVETMAR